jgi:hypothetical protein
MLPVNFKESNFIFKKPVGWSDEMCSDLYVWKGVSKIEGTDKEVPAIISCWQLSREDLDEIIKTGVVWLSVTGSISMPPVSVFIENPFEQ